jgi:hypothetical protein
MLARHGVRTAARRRGNRTEKDLNKVPILVVVADGWDIEEKQFVMYTKFRAEMRRVRSVGDLKRYYRQWARPRFMERAHLGKKSGRVVTAPQASLHRLWSDRKIPPR